MEVDEKTKKRI